MKNLLFTILFAFTMSVNAQYYSLTYVTVPAENQEEFVRLETQYWSKVAKHNVEAGKQIAWGLVQAVGGVPNGWTHVFVNVYETAEQLADSSIWDPETILGISPSEINTLHLVEGRGVQNWAVQSSIPGERGEVAVWNFARPKNLAGFINENKNLWKKQFENDMGGRTNWGIGLKLNNRSQDLSTVMTWDGYPNLAEALKALNNYEGQWPRQSKMQEYDPDGFTASVIVNHIMWVG